MIRDLLVLCESDFEAAGPYGLSLAALLGAHLTAVALVPERVSAGPWRELPRTLLDAMYEDNHRAAEQALEPFREAQQASVDAEIVVVPAGQSPESQFRWLARHFDLTIAAQFPPDGPINDNMLEAVLFGSGRPILVVPYRHSTPARLGTILIAWDESATAARAVGDALPLLTRADRVELVTVTEVRLRADMPQTRLAQHLARHGIHAKSVSVPKTGGVAEALLSYGADCGADLLVMGGYGHSRLREFVLGGTTRSMLTSMTIPTLFAH